MSYTLQKIVFCLLVMLCSSSTSSSGSSTGGGVVACVFLVDLNPLGVRRPCPLFVSSESGKWRRTASKVSPGHDANCLFLIALSHVGLVGNPAAACKYRTSSGCVFSSYTLWTASAGLGRFDRNSLGGRLSNAVSVFRFRTMRTNGMRQRFVLLSRHPLRIAPLVTVMVVSLAS